MPGPQISDVAGLDEQHEIVILTGSLMALWYLLVWRVNSETHCHGLIILLCVCVSYWVSLGCVQTHGEHVYSTNLPVTMLLEKIHESASMWLEL